MFRVLRGQQLLERKVPRDALGSWQVQHERPALQAVLDDVLERRKDFRDFAVVDMGPPIHWNADLDCYRNP